MYIYMERFILGNSQQVQPEWDEGGAKTVYQG